MLQPCWFENAEVWEWVQFCKDRRFEAYYASDLGSKRTNNTQFRCWKILIPTKILFILNVIYITVQLLYNEILCLTNHCFFLTPVIVKYKAIWKKPRYKLTNLVVTKIFCQPLGPSLYRGCTVLNFIYLFSKSGVPGPPKPSPLRRPCNVFQPRQL